LISFTEPAAKEAINRCFEINAAGAEVASISGHRDIWMLMRYTHPMRQRIIEQMDKGEPKVTSDFWDF
jgi:hypothetical protein